MKNVVKIWDAVVALPESRRVEEERIASDAVKSGESVEQILSRMQEITIQTSQIGWQGIAANPALSTNDDYTYTQFLYTETMRVFRIWLRQQTIQPTQDVVQQQITSIIDELTRAKTAPGVTDIYTSTQPHRLQSSPIFTLFVKQIEKKHLT
jgi:hypothetical protein